MVRKNMFLYAKSLQNIAKMIPKICEKNLQKTMPKTRRPIIKNIINNEVPEPQKALFFLRKNLLQLVWIQLMKE